MSRSVARIQFDGALVLVFRAIPIPFVKSFDERERGVRFGQSVVNLQSLLGSPARSRHGFIGWKMSRRERVISIRQPRVGQSIFRINVNRLLKMADGVVE